jgi:F-type H+-transporting ATPase subunit delta
LPAAKSGIAKRYAEAVFGIAKDQNSFERWTTELQSIAQVQSDPEVGALLATPAVGMSVKEAFVAKALPDVSVEAMNLVRVLLRRGRFHLAPQISNHFQNLLNEHQGIATAEVTSAIPLTKQEVRALERRLSALTGRQVVVELAVDPSIIGGIVARIGDQLIDASIQGRLEALKKQLATA